MNTQLFDIDSSHSAAHFSVRHLMISNVKGEFSKVTGTIAYNPENPTATRIDAAIDLNSINTREPARDAHLKSADFFDAATYPALRFQSKEDCRAKTGKCE